MYPTRTIRAFRCCTCLGLLLALSVASNPSCRGLLIGGKADSDAAARQFVLLTHFGHRRLTIAAARIDHCAPFRWSQFPVLIARVESQIWRVPGKAMRRRE